MTPRELVLLHSIDSFITSDDPQLDEVLRAGMPSRRRRRAGWLLVAGGLAVCLAGCLAQYPFLVLVGLLAATVAAYLSHRSPGPAPTLLTLISGDAWPPMDCRAPRRRRPV
jgi:hypothetical protein